MSWSKWRRPAAEFLVIFASITLSLMAEDWRRSRQDLADRDTALELILKDLAQDSSLIEEALGYGRRHERSAYRITHYWDDPDAPADSIQHAFRETMFIGDVQLFDAAYSSLREAGRLALIRDEELRAQIVNYYERDQPSFADWASARWSARLEFFEAIYDYVLFPRSETPDRAWPVTGPVRLVVPWSEITRDPQVYNRISGFGASATVLRWTGDALLEGNLELRASIEAALQ
jgi:hypothetical protein